MIIFEHNTKFIVRIIWIQLSIIFCLAYKVFIDINTIRQQAMDIHQQSLSIEALNLRMEALESKLEKAQSLHAEAITSKTPIFDASFFEPMLDTNNPILSALSSRPLLLVASVLMAGLAGYYSWSHFDTLCANHLSLVQYQVRTLNGEVDGINESLTAVVRLTTNAATHASRDGLYATAQLSDQITQLSSQAANLLSSNEQRFIDIGQYLYNVDKKIDILLSIMTAT